jgi:hypothetical protein
MYIITSKIKLLTKKHLETLLIIHINKTCGKYSLVSYEYHDTGKKRLTWEGLKKIYVVEMIGELSIVNTVISELKRIEKGKKYEISDYISS